MTLCALHNGGGVGIGKCINGGFGLLLDGRPETDEIIKSAMMWDVLGGVARRAWGRCGHAIEVATQVNKTQNNSYHITLPYIPNTKLIEQTVENAWEKR